ncbi:MAG: CDP-diacylglycerol--glycerol-3-phosphate 3-phosphatidyltransferase [Hyphomicrobiaceae bacterium]|nr:MAG: CDP-diacylglycerol--glycerol-3-phosphate 3-phosphatidyltransferase [Hyphomicrobiaceae bacterium]
MQPPLWTLPNVISSFRIAAGPVCIYLLADGSPLGLWLALLTMIAAEISDFLDGHLARTWGQISNFGKILDPMADSLYRIAIFVAFAANRWMPVWMLALFLCRDIAVSYLRIIAEEHGHTLAARMSGKLKAVFQATAQLMMVGLLALATVWELPASEGLRAALLTAAAAVTAYSLIDYAADVLARMARKRAA